MKFQLFAVLACILGFAFYTGQKAWGMLMYPNHYFLIVSGNMYCSYLIYDCKRGLNSLVAKYAMSVIKIFCLVLTCLTLAGNELHFKKCTRILIYKIK